MTNQWMATASTAALIAGLLLGVSACAQSAETPDLFTTENFRNDRTLWTDPAYYRNNSWGQLRGQAFNFDSGGQGSGQIASSRTYGTEGTAEPVTPESKYDLE